MHACLYAQVKRIMAAYLERVWPPQDARAAQRIFTDAHLYLSQRIPTLSSFCVVCDAQLPSPGPKPVPCQDPKCIFAYDELGLGSGDHELLCLACPCPTACTCWAVMHGVRLSAWIVHAHRLIWQACGDTWQEQPMHYNKMPAGACVSRS